MRRSALKTAARRPSRTTFVVSSAVTPSEDAPTSRPGWLASICAAAGLALNGRCRTALPWGDKPEADPGPLSDAVWAAAGCFVAVALLGLIDEIAKPAGVPFLLGSFGTLSVLFFAVGPSAPVLRPWNVIGGHLAASGLAILAHSLLQPLWLARAAALALCVAFMRLTGCVHPPGGALVILLMDSPAVRSLGWAYLVFPGLVGASLIAAVGLATAWLRGRFVFTRADVEGTLGWAPRRAAVTAAG